MLIDTTYPIQTKRISFKINSTEKIIACWNIVIYLKKLYNFNVKYMNKTYSNADIPRI